MHALAPRPHARHERAPARTRHLLRGLHRDRSGQHPPHEKPAPDRNRISRSAGPVRRRIQSRHGCRRGQGAPERNRTLEAEQGARGSDGQHQEQTNSQETREAFETRAGLRLLAFAPRMDGARSASGHPAGSASARSLGRRPLCDLRFERSLSSRYQPQQPSQKPAPAENAGCHYPQ